MEDNWNSPIDRSVKLKIKRRKSIPANDQLRKSNGQALSPLTNSLTGGKPTVKNVLTKRKNPFQCDSNRMKRQRSDKDAALKDDFSFFKKSREMNRQLLSSNVEDGSKLDDDTDVPVKVIGHKNSKSSSLIGKENNYDRNFCSSEEFPTDWTLKTRVKFKSDKPFSWCTNSKTQSTSMAIVNFVRCSTQKCTFKKNGETEQLKTEFRKHLLNWVYPNIPIIPSFPVSEDVLQQESSSNICKDDGIRTALMKSWNQSFHSVFTLTRYGFCPFFYFCCQNFTAVFMSFATEQLDMVALITPTTKGFRELLTKDGIEFDMPLLNMESNEKINNQDNGEKIADDDNDSDKENMNDNDEDFLSSIGLNAKNFSSIKKQKLNDELTKLQGIDRKPRSTVIVRDVNALFNFLINTDLIVAQSGAYQGVPPTLIAPVAFEGASMQSLKCVQGPMKYQDKGCMKQVYGLEISGLILPSQFYNICHLIKTMHSSYEAVITPNTRSLSFNCLQNSQNELKLESPGNFGIDQSTLKYLHGNSSLMRKSLMELRFGNGEFEWKTNNL